MDPVEDDVPEVEAQNDPETTPSGPGEGPWAKDLEFFEDEQIRGQVDTFLREKVQPRITQLEQAQTPEEAAVLYSQLQENPLDTYVKLTEALYGEEASQKVAAALNDYYGLNDDEDFDYEGEEQVQQDPELTQVKEIVLAQEREKAYNAKIDELKAEHPQVDGDAIAPFVVSAEGDWDLALKEYLKWYESMEAKFKPQQEVTPEQVPDAPQTLGGGPSTPPIKKEYKSIDDALDDFFAEEAAKQAPPVV